MSLVDLIHHHPEKGHLRFPVGDSGRLLQQSGYEKYPEIPPPPRYVAPNPNTNKIVQSKPSPNSALVGGPAGNNRNQPRNQQPKKQTHSPVSSSTNQTAPILQLSPSTIMLSPSAGFITPTSQHHKMHGWPEMPGQSHNVFYPSNSGNLVREKPTWTCHTCGSTAQCLCSKCMDVPYCSMKCQVSKEWGHDILPIGYKGNSKTGKRKVESLKKSGIFVIYILSTY
jgi:hypothetical protein